MAKSSKSKSRTPPKGEQTTDDATRQAKKALEANERLILDLKELSKFLRKIIAHRHNEKG